MTIEEFAAITETVIAKDGFDDFLPSAFLPASNELRALQGVPADVPMETAAANWVKRLAPNGEEVLVAFKHDSTNYKIMRFAGEHHDERVFPYVPPKKRPWWRF